MKKSETKSKMGTKNTARNKVSRIIRELRKANGKAITDLNARMRYWVSKG